MTVYLNRLNRLNLKLILKKTNKIIQRNLKDKMNV